MACDPRLSSSSHQKLCLRQAGQSIFRHSLLCAAEVGSFASSGHAGGRGSIAGNRCEAFEEAGKDSTASASSRGTLSHRADGAENQRRETRAPTTRSQPSHPRNSEPETRNHRGHGAASCPFFLARLRNFGFTGRVFMKSGWRSENSAGPSRHCQP
jgi:hypothetical protein